MCIIYSEAKTAKQKMRKQDEFTVYKMYKVFKSYHLDGGVPRYLYSPYKSHMKGGHIKRSGTYVAHNPYTTNKSQEKAIGRFALYFSSKARMRVTAKAFAQADGLPIDCYGFHCFLTRKGEEEYVQKRDHQASSAKVVVVPVKVRRQDLIIAGGEAARAGMDDLVNTATFKRITISKVAYKKAVK